MGERSAIEWTDATWNPWRGCDKVSPGCAHCYMFTDQHRYGRDPGVVVHAAPATFQAPLSKKWRRQAADIFSQDGRRMRVFTCSWSDWFHETADPWREEAWSIVRACPEYDFQILTKRPERILEHLPADWGDGWPNVWFGVSIENRRFVHRADQLRQVPAAVRFISAEPLLGPLTPLLPGLMDDGVYLWWDRSIAGYVERDDPGLSLEGIDWVICGGESGPGHRAIQLSWVRSLLDHCLENRWEWDCDGPMDTIVGCRDEPPFFFFKQWGGSRPGGEALVDGREWREFPPSASFVGQGALL